MAWTRPLAVLSVLVASVLAVPAGDGPRAPDWTTPAERADFRSTPRLDETVAWLERAAQASPWIRVTTFGESGAGRPLPLVLVDRDGAFTPGSARERGRTVVLIQNGIHGGEIDGKDACLLLLRDLLEGQERDVLDGVTVLIVPVLNADGHERVSPRNRPNQNGPVEGMGFRTNAAGLDLNRDHLKADSPEIRALLDLFREWRPHLHVDGHVTDGSDHDWVLTYSWVEAPQAPPALDAWLGAHMPRVVEATRARGVSLGPYVSLVDRADPSKGFSSYVGRPWYATGYWPLRNRPSILVENHAYKPYEARVRANHAFLVELLRVVAADGGALREAVATAEARTVEVGRPSAAPTDVVLSWEIDDAEPDTVSWPAYAWSLEPSVALGTPVLRYRAGEIREVEAPWFHRPRPARTVRRPRGYLVAPGRPAVEARLRAHALRVERLTEDVVRPVDRFRIDGAGPAPSSYQGRIGAVGEVRTEAVTETVPAGTLWIPADQPDFEVAVQLLEPESPDSLHAWGFFKSDTERKEYIEPRVLEDWVVEALADDDDLVAAWSEALEDDAFAADPGARWLWWYRRSPWWDDTVGLLPVRRLRMPLDAPTEPWD